MHDEHDDQIAAESDADPITMPIAPAAPASDVLSALSAPLPPPVAKGQRVDVISMPAAIATVSETGWTVGDLPPPPIARREESGPISDRNSNRLAVAAVPQIAAEEATRPFPSTEAELRAELMRVRTEAAQALSAAEDRLTAAARAMTAQKDSTRRGTLADQAELQKKANRLAAELAEARAERDEAQCELEEMRGEIDAIDAARGVLEGAIEARDLRGQIAEARAAALEQRAAAAEAALLR
ncbi:MAG: hypothetical protein ACJ78V_17735, partial [Myxococcales bacterium]